MLSGDFFIIKTLQTEDNAASALLEFNTGHPIFKGHFPGQPVVPGACLLQIVKEVMQTITGMELQLKKAHQIKFLSIIDPVKNNILRIIIKHSISWVVTFYSTITYPHTKVCIGIHFINCSRVHLHNTLQYTLLDRDEDRDNHWTLCCFLKKELRRHFGDVLLHLV